MHAPAVSIASLVFCFVFFSTALADSCQQWGRDPQHWGFTPVVGQSPSRILADVIYDPFSTQERAEAGSTLLTHFQAASGRRQRRVHDVQDGLSRRIKRRGLPAKCVSDNMSSLATSILSDKSTTASYVSIRRLRPARHVDSKVYHRGQMRLRPRGLEVVHERARV